MIHSMEAMLLLIGLLTTSPFDIRKEVAYVLGNLCVESAEGDTKPRIIQEHLVSIVSGGCPPGFINLVRSPDIEAARLGLQFIELVLRGMPKGEGSKLVEGEDGIDAMERFQFHENEELRVIANSLVENTLVKIVESINEIASELRSLRLGFFFGLCCCNNMCNTVLSR